MVNLHDSGEISVLESTLKILKKLPFKRPFQALLLKISGKCQKNANSYPVLHRGAAEGIWLARRAMDFRRLRTTALHKC
jgi:hypothetical protein